MKFVSLTLTLSLSLFCTKAIAEPVQLNCHMNQCTWGEILSKNVIDTGADGGSLLKVSSKTGYSGHPEVGRVDGVEYPETYSNDFETEWSGASDHLVYCSPTRPTYIGDENSIQTFSFPMVYGTEVTSSQFYLNACHNTNKPATDELLKDLGYMNIQAQEFSSIDQLLGKANSPQNQKNVFFKVVDVASNDVLNIRSQPTSKSEIIGSFAYNQPLVEITGKDGKWFRVNSGERSGWVYSRYLKPIHVKVIQNTNLPDGLRCFGEEPFWSVRIQGNQIYLSDPNNGDQVYNLTNTQSIESSTSLSGTNNYGQIKIVIDDKISTSSMVERYYNWSVSLILDGSEVSGATGCGM